MHKRKKKRQVGWLRCVECRSRYTMADVKKAVYFPSTAMCVSCYENLMDKNRAGPCGRKAVHCKTQECPDHHLCEFLKEELTHG